MGLDIIIHPTEMLMLEVFIMVLKGANKLVLFVSQVSLKKIDNKNFSVQDNYTFQYFSTLIIYVKLVKKKFQTRSQLIMLYLVHHKYLFHCNKSYMIHIPK